MKFVIERSKKAFYSYAGLSLVGSLIKESGLTGQLDKNDPKRSAVEVYPSSDIAKTLMDI